MCGNGTSSQMVTGRSYSPAFLGTPKVLFRELASGCSTFTDWGRSHPEISGTVRMGQRKI
jgi:hypothetical protein